MRDCLNILVRYLGTLTVLFYSAGNMLMDTHPVYVIIEFYLCGDDHRVELKVTQFRKLFNPLVLGVHRKVTQT